MDKNLKKTIDAHGTVSEEKALKKAKEIEKTTKEMIEIKIKKEKEIELEQEEMLLKKIDEENKKALSKSAKEEEKITFKDPKSSIIESWQPKTQLGRDVKNGKIKNIDEILDSNKKILEEKIVDYLIDVKTDLISIGQAKGKFGGGKRRAWRQTQRKTQEGNKLTFSAMAVVGDENGHIGFGIGKATETLPARDKAIRKAKLNLIKVQRACSSFDCSCNDPHSIPFKVEGKAGSVSITLTPAPQGTGLVVAGELKKVLKLAGIKDIYSKSFGKQRTSFNSVKACFNALKKTNKKIGEDKK
ncbi:MAG: 30S ribosomal protein S5 [Candidatus Pacearchaeota archaeon]|jgi:small subunit ribosomal protein S5